MASILFDKEYNKNIITLALGYLSYPTTITRYRKLCKIISSANFQNDGSSMLVSKIPPTKLKLVLKTFKEIKKKKVYWNCDYLWTGGNNFKLPKK